MKYIFFPLIILRIPAVILAFTGLSAAAFPRSGGSAREATVTGRVTCGDSPLSGVSVSDGYTVTATDADGFYRLASRKKNGYVFLTIPSGYEVASDGSLPAFWASLSEAPGRPERHDFRLTRVDNDRHILLAVTDIHLANLYNDKEQYCITFLPDVRRLVERQKKYKIYTLCLGDMSFDLFWYSHRYDIADYRQTLRVAGYPTPVFHAIGNHDHDGAVVFSDSTDFVAAGKYRKALGPTWYSFNLGRIHYVVLDNIVYKNEPGGKKGDGIAGQRNYEIRITPEQLAWLRQDLARVSDKTAPVVVAMHAPFYRTKGISDEVIASRYSEELAACFDGFSEVHYLDGHTHSNNTCRPPGRPNLIEHNIAAVCGSWWKTGSRGRPNLCPDGSPAGYGVFTADGKRLSWYYRSTGHEPEYQFRTFDMNEVRRYCRSSAAWTTFLEHYPERIDFRRLGDNRVYIHVWGWEPAWKLVVTEGGKRLATERVATEDPLSVLLYDLPETVGKGVYPERFASSLKKHIFSVEASGPATTLVIRVTDAFGKVYKERMKRPKAFDDDRMY